MIKKINKKMGRLMGIEPTYAGATTRSVKPLRHKRHFVKLLIYFNIKYKYYCNLAPKKLNSYFIFILIVLIN